MCTGPNGTCPSGMVLHIKNFALHGLISHRDHSNVNHVSSLILSNICIKTLIYHPIAQRHYKELQYKAEEKDKTPYWASIHKERKVYKGYHPSQCCQSVGAKREREQEAGAWECIFQKMVGSEASPERLYIYIQKKTCRMPN
jgi:hypothetical protein